MAKIVLLLVNLFVISALYTSTTEAKRYKRVIGGVEIEAGEWPWLVHLKGKIPAIRIFGIPMFYKNYYCSASLLNERWLLTAAHCFVTRDAPVEIIEPEHWHAKLGDIDSTHTMVDRAKSLVSDFIDEPDWKMWYMDIEQIIIHPDFNETDDWKHDLALVKLNTDLPLDDYEVSRIISPVLLPLVDENKNWPDPSDFCIMKGWGCTENGGAVSNIARSINLPILPNSRCIFQNISNTRICAGYNFANTGICPGDSGGPLVCRFTLGSSEYWVQAGAASFTSAFRPDSVPGVFTKVSLYVNWIKQVTENNISILRI